MKHHQQQQRTRDEELADFHIAVYSRARELQFQRTGLLSNSDAVRIATFEHFCAGMLAIKNSVDHVRLLGGEMKEEQIQAMKDYAKLASSSSHYSCSKEATLIVQAMLDKFGASAAAEEKEQENNVIDTPDGTYGVRTTTTEKDECIAP